jgi:predicted O-methyltransferase YrrM
MTGRRGRALLRAKAGYTATLHGAGRALDRAGLLPAAPPDRTHRIRHWAYSLTRVHDSAALADLDVPWWTYRAIDTVEAWLAARPGPVRIFEYGSGASTLWLGRRADEVHSVEHDRAFAELFAPRLAGHLHVEVRVVEPVAADHPVVASAKEGYAGCDFANYVAAIDDVDGAFDVVVVDGRARAECLRRAVPRLRPGGIVVFDNSRRARYRPAIAASGLVEQQLRGLTPTLPYPEQTSLLTSRP